MVGEKFDTHSTCIIIKKKSQQQQERTKANENNM